MELNEYQIRAMSTCMDSCNNVAYMLTGLNAECGEINDKIAKAIRRGHMMMTDNGIVFKNCESENCLYKHIQEKYVVQRYYKVELKSFHVNGENILK